MYCVYESHNFYKAYSEMSYQMSFIYIIYYGTNDLDLGLKFFFLLSITIKF